MSGRAETNHGTDRGRRSNNGSNFDDNGASPVLLCGSDRDPGWFGRRDTANLWGFGGRGSYRSMRLSLFD